MIIGVIGLGLIGGSVAWDLKSQLMISVLGYDQSEAHASEALERSLVSEIVDYDTLIDHAEVIILAIPVHHIADSLASILDQISDKQMVIDLGSTKSNIAHKVKSHSRRGRYVAAHPLAGTEFSGPSAAMRNLFNGKKNIICDRELTDADALDTALAIFKSLGMRSYYMNSEDHDMHLAYVSHLSHISSFTLGLTVLDIEKDEKTILNLAGTGLRSTVRLAASSADTWTPILEANQRHLIKALDQYILRLKAFKDALQLHDKDTITQLINESNSISKILN